MNNHESYCHSDQERWIFRWKTGVVLLSNFITKSHRGFLSVEVVGLDFTTEISKEPFIMISSTYEVSQLLEIKAWYIL